MVINFTPINERLCIIRIKGRFFNCSLINIQLEWAYAVCPSHDVKLVMGDANAKVGRETGHQPTIGKHSLHESTYENGLSLVDFAAGRQMAIKSMFFMKKRIHYQTWHSPDRYTFNQINHCLIDARHFSDVIDVMVRNGANIYSDHMPQSL
jgi:endonuclease/exonuclease/phosphatase family metal-dependent hydrolase